MASLISTTLTVKQRVSAILAAMTAAKTAALAAQAAAELAETNAETAETAAESARDTILARQVASIAAMQALTSAAVTANGQEVVVADSSRGGVFTYDSSLASFDNVTTFEATDAGVAGGFRRRFSGPISIEWAGVVLDGATDNKTSFQLAVTAAVALKRPLFVPEGNALITFASGESISVTGDLEIVGVGEYKSIISAGPSATTFAYSCFKTSTTDIRLTFRDLELRGPAAVFKPVPSSVSDDNSSNPETKGIEYTGGDNGVLRLENVRITQNFRTCLEQGGDSDSKVVLRHVYMKGWSKNIAAGGDGTCLRKRIHGHDVHFDGCNSPLSHNAVYPGPSVSLWFNTCRFSNTITGAAGYALHPFGSADFIPEYFVLENCVFDKTTARAVLIQNGRMIASKTKFFSSDRLLTLWENTDGQNPKSSFSLNQCQLGQYIRDASIEAASSTLTCSKSAPFTSAMVNATVNIVGAGAAGATLVTTIATYVSETEVTLAAPASTTVTNAQMSIENSQPIVWAGGATGGEMDFTDCRLYGSNFAVGKGDSQWRFTNCQFRLKARIQCKETIDELVIVGGYVEGLSGLTYGLLVTKGDLITIDGVTWKSCGPPILINEVTGTLGRLVLRNNDFTRSSGAAVTCVAGINGLIDGHDNLFNTLSINHPTSGWSRLSLRKGISSTTYASASTVELDPNNDTFKISGTATIGTLRIAGEFYTPGFAATVYLISTGGFTLGTTNIRTKTGSGKTIPANSAVTLTFDPEAGIWYEV